MDQPPVAPLLAALSQAFGESLAALRAVPAALAAGAVYVSCILAVELGGGLFAEVLTAICVALSPVLCALGMKVSPDMTALWLWPFATLYVVRLVKGADGRWWLAVGAIVSCAILSKYTAVFFVASMIGGLMFTRARRILFSRWFLGACGLCTVILLPNILWQARFGFPQLEMLRNAEQGKIAIVGPLTYLLQQVIITGTLMAFVWAAGLVWLFSRPEWRWLAWAYVLLIAMMIVLHGKHYYPASVYAGMFAAGAVAVESWTGRRRGARAVIAGFVSIAGIAMAPLVLPILTETQSIAYTNRLLDILHIRRETLAAEKGREAELSSDWAGMHGWPELAMTVARVYNGLPVEDRRQAAIAANNYGEAGAIDFFGRKYGLPPAISGHNQYFLWGPRGYSGNVTICVGVRCGSSGTFDRCERAATFTAPWIQPYEDNLPIEVCRGIRKPLSEIWPSVKNYR